ncbi:MAG: hypothetical protein RLY88_471 [Actinomycetota bacterium]|jgi:NitT/TauT family transport system substrate-binding protein
MRKALRIIRLSIVPALLLALMFSAPITTAAPTDTNTGASDGLPAKLRIGYFANITHAPALVAAQQKLWQQALPGVAIEPFIFNSGSAAVEALKGGALDVSYMGPNPAIAGYSTTNGTLLRIISGATSGGAQFITNAAINSIDDLRGKNIASPGLGGTQDVALKYFLHEHGLVANRDVMVTPTENASTLQLFQQGQIDGAWVPEPWASRLVLEGNGKVFVDEASLWPNQQFATTNLVATTTFLQNYPNAIKLLLKANLQAIQLIESNPKLAQSLVQVELLKQSGKKLSQPVIDRAWKHLQFTSDPLAASLATNSQQAQDIGLLNLQADGIKSIFDLRILNEILLDSNLQPVSAASNGKQ